MISILMATYNGELYIKEQIESLLAQTRQNFTLYVNDDHSSDRTYEIIKDYAVRYPERIIATQNPSNSGNSKYNFLQMMSEHRDDYLMLCDQDDIWLPDKIDHTLKKMRQMEQTHGKQTPLLVYTDLKVVDEKLDIISESLMHRVNADFTKNDLKDQLVQNTVTGCTVMYNRAAAELIREIPEYTVMHDWWLMLVTCAFGHAEVLDEPTILYRQHGDNSVGTRDMRSAGFMLRFFMKGDIIKKALNETYHQAEALLHMYGEKMPADKRKLTARYAAIGKQKKFARIIHILRLGTWKQGICRRIAQLIYC